MCDWDNPITDYWLKYYIDRESDLCALCGNTGTIILYNVRNPSGELLKSAHTDYCICPNGQSLRKRKDDK
jgi:hypothetical protein